MIMCKARYESLTVTFGEITENNCKSTRCYCLQKRILFMQSIHKMEEMP